ncbi:GNAT family N-acetyltransferase [Nakamurella sp. A5-74]|uniref:GNAT family N-acetyltransferase n=1 Tax=Nakamurella sp. A5-74 TaxID=3158264 RepID=A0AAU8DLV1_9ACTN
MSVRRARSSDALSIRRLAEGFGTAGDPPASGQFDHEYARIISDDTWLLAVAEDAGTVRGYALAQDYGPGLRASFTTGRLRDLYVEPAFRRRGSARALVRSVVSWAHTRPLPMILDWQASASAVDFYRRLGFEPDHVGDFPEYPGFSLDTRTPPG